MQKRFPDFIIGGAPKCGTTSLHFILNQHPDIALPDDEVHYFDADDPTTHPDFFSTGGNGQLNHYDTEDPSFRDQYATKFEMLAGAKFIGEDSTTYLMSPAAPPRIQSLLPKARVIFMLRDPVARAYSQYWHSVTRGRATQTFEKALVDDPSIILGSTYLAGLERFRSCLASDRIKVILFEDFIADQQRVIDGVCDFLGAKRMVVRQEASWFNRSMYPTWLAGQLSLNRIGRYVVALRYRNHLASRPGVRSWLEGRLHYHWFRRVNPLLLKASKPPEMRPDTRAYLARHLARRNEGLSTFLDRDLGAVWPGFEG